MTITKYRIDTERTELTNMNEFKLFGDESFELSSLIVDSLAAAANAALQELGFESLEEMIDATGSGVTVKVVGRDVWLKIIP